MYKADERVESRRRELVSYRLAPSVRAWPIVRRRDQCDSQTIIHQTRALDPGGFCHASASRWATRLVSGRRLS